MKTTCWSSNEHQNGEEGDLAWLNVEWLLMPEGWSEYFQKLLIYWDFTHNPSLVFTENGLKQRKYPVSGSCVDENALLMSEVRGEWTDWLEMIERQTVTQITTRYNQVMQNIILEHTTRRTPEQMDSSSRRPHRVPLLSDKNRHGGYNSHRITKTGQ